jgi:biotin carboxyl carrier protein
MRYFVKVADEVWEVEVEGDRVRVGAQELRARILDGSGGEPAALELDGLTHSLVVGRPLNEGRTVYLDGRPHRVDAETERARRVREMRGVAGAARGPRPLKAPMPGLVVKVEVEEGQAVAAGQGLVIVEAMKMENELQAETDAVVARILVEAGQAVEKDQVLLDFEAPRDEEAAS